MGFEIPRYPYAFSAAGDKSFLLKIRVSFTTPHAAREIRLTSAEQTGHGINQDTKGRLAQLTAGLAQRQTPLHPAIALVAGRAMRALAPQHTKTQRPFGAIVGRVDAMFAQKHPQ